MRKMVVHETIAGLGRSELPAERILTAVLVLHAGEVARGIEDIQIGRGPASRGIQAQVLAKAGARWLPADAHFIDLMGIEFREIETRLNGPRRKARVVFYAADALLGDGEQQFAVLYKARRRIVHLRVVETEGDHATNDPPAIQKRGSRLPQ